MHLSRRFFINNLASLIASSPSSVPRWASTGKSIMSQNDCDISCRIPISFYNKSIPIRKTLPASHAPANSLFLPRVALTEVRHVSCGSGLKYRTVCHVLILRAWQTLKSAVTYIGRRSVKVDQWKDAVVWMRSTADPAVVIRYRQEPEPEDSHSQQQFSF